VISQKYKVVQYILFKFFLKFVEQAIKNRKLFVLDYYEPFMTYLTKINDLPSTEAYATRTFLILKEDGTLKPIAIELSKPYICPCGLELVETTVVLPADKGVKSTIWQLAKAHVNVNDTSYHELISHWYIYITTQSVRNIHMQTCLFMLYEI